jgi:hypothetical protein
MEVGVSFGLIDRMKLPWHLRIHS